MDKKVVKSSLLMLFIAEIMLCVSSLAFLNLISMLAFFKYAALSGFCAYILIIIAAIRLRNTCGEFRQVFWCAMASMILSTISFVIGFFPDVIKGITEDGLRAIVLTKALLGLFSAVIDLFMVVRTIDGCAIVTKTEEHLPQAKLAIKLFIGAVAIAVVTYLVETIFAYVQGPGVFLDICSIASLVMRVASEILYIIFLFKSYKEIEVVK